jgi:hypothetical protein
MSLTVLLLGSLVGLAGATGPGGWGHLGDGGASGTPSLNGAVFALNADRPNTLYVGGNFTAAGGVSGADRIASWNGSAWSAVSSPSSQIANGAVNAIAYDAATGHVFVGGTFVNAGGNANADFLAVWNGTSWAPFCNSASPPIPATVNALQIVGRTLYVAGDFGAAAEVPSAARLVACNLDTGAASSTVDSLAHAFSGTIYALAADSNGTLYAGGGFTNLGADPAADNIAYRDGTGWHSMGSGGGSCSCAVNDFVRSLTAVGTNVYVGTDASDVAGIARADHVVRWSGSAWSAVGSNTAGSDGWFPASAFINGMANDGSNVYATGSFQNANGDPRADFIASFDGTAWHAVGSDGAGNGPWTGNGLAVAKFGGKLVAGGNFTSAGGDTQARFVAEYPGDVASTAPTAIPVPIGVTDPGYAHAAAKVALLLGKLTPSASGELSLKAHNANAFPVSAVSLEVTSLAPVASGRASARPKPVKFLKSAKPVALGAGKTAILKGRLSRAGLAVLKQLGHVRVQVRVVVKAPGGARSAAASKGTLHAPG